MRRLYPLKNFLHNHPHGKLWAGSALMALACTTGTGLVVLAILQLFLVLVFVVGRLWALRCARQYELTQGGSPDASAAKVCVQIATYCEPPELVIETLRSLESLTYSNYEVLVVDNNTSDPALYEPVAEYCRAKGFTFVHLDRVRGAKAGALNLARPLVDPRVEYVLVLDADYVASPNIIETGLLHFRCDDIALVQFPQSYRNTTENCPLAYEYGTFFEAYMTTAQVANSVLATGTAAFVRQKALDEIGGWPTGTITEDADLGLRLHRVGYRGVYVHQAIARGLLPYSLSDFLKQRSRWIMGNLQCLRSHTLGSLSWRGRLSAVLQLTAWIHPLILFPWLLAGSTIARLSVGSAEAPASLDCGVSLAVTSAMLYLSYLLVFFSLASPTASLKARLGAVLVHIATFWTSMFSVFGFLSGRPLTFVRTNKFLSPETVDLNDFAGVALPLSVLAIGQSMWGANLSWLWMTAALPAVSCLYLKYIFHKIRKRSE